ncbi:MAG: hypothetical protein ACI3T9_02200 [Romboutsia timonensis]
MSKCIECSKREQCKKEIEESGAIIEPITEEVSKKFEILNSMEVEDYDADEDGIIYIHVFDDEENRNKLKELGATEEDFEQMLEGMEGTECLDITLFGFEKLGADCWSSSEGFKLFSEED